MVEYAGQPVEVLVEIVDGWWALDKMAGKRLMAVRLHHIPTDRKTPAYVPTTEDITKIIRVYLDCERRNDSFVFPDGTQRPSELQRKLAVVQEVLDSFSEQSEQGECRELGWETDAGGI